MGSDDEFVRAWSADQVPFLNLLAEEAAKSAYWNENPEGYPPPWEREAPVDTPVPRAALTMTGAEPAGVFAPTRGDRPTEAEQRAAALTGRPVSLPPRREPVATVMLGPVRPPPAPGPADSPEDPRQPWNRLCLLDTIFPDRPHCFRCVWLVTQPSFVGPAVDIPVTLTRSDCSRCGDSTPLDSSRVRVCESCRDWLRTRKLASQGDRFNFAPRESASGNTLETRAHFFF